MADYLPPVVAKLTGDDASLTRVLAASKDKVRRWAVEVGKTKVTLQVDAKLRDGTLAELRRRVADGPAAKLKVNLELAAGQREALRASLADREIQAKVVPKVDQTALRRVQTILMELGRPINVSVRPGVDDRTQRRTEATLTRLSRDRTATIRTRVIGGGTPGSGAGSAGGDVKALATLISLGPALVPIAASLASVAVQAGAAGIAVGAFGLAAKSQISGISGAADAQAKYNAAVAKYGQNSKQAQAAQEASARSLDGMPAATQRATEGWLHLKDAFKSWSDSLAGATMEPVTRSFAVAEGILPRLSPMVKGTADQLNRLVTIAGGAVASPGFDAFMKRVSDFANGVLKHATDDVVHFARVLSEGSAGGGAVAQFMAYAKQEGPAVRQTLADLAKAVDTILKASAQAGPSMLTLVDDVAKLVAALPPAFVARVMQVYAAFRLFKLANSGITAVTEAVTSLAGRMTALRAASAAAGGGVRGVGAAVGSLSTGAKVAGAVGVIAGLAFAAYKLVDGSKQARVSIDDLSRSIEKGLGQGAISSPVLDELRQGMAGVLKETDASASAWDKMGYSLTHWGAKWSSSASSTKAVANAQRDLGKAIGEIAKNQGVDKATQALALLNKEGAKVPTKYLKDYNNALADQQFSDKMAAQSMGLFGDQAQAVQKKLDAQRQAAQGLQQAILDLNDANRAAMDAESNYQQAIDDATAAIKHHRNALHYSNGELNLNSQKAREAYGALSQMAASAEAASTAVLQQTGSQEKANRVLIDAHDRLIATAEKMGLNTADAHRLADALDNIHDPKIQVTVNIMQAEANLAAAQKKVNSFPKSARTTANFDYQKALSDLQFYQREVDMLHGKTITVVINGVKTGVNASDYYSQGPHKGNAYGGVIRAFAAGGTVPGYAPMRDTVPAVLSPGEGVLVPEAVRAMGGESGINSINRQARGGGSLAHGATSMGVEVAAGLWQGMSSRAGWLAAQARQFALATIPQPMADALGIRSPSRVAMALGRWVGAGMVQGLTGSTASVKAATLRLTRSIEQVFHDDAERQLAADKKKLASLAGVKGKKAARERADVRSDMRQQEKYLKEDSAVSRFVAADNKRLLRLAAERDTVASKLKAAQSKLTSLEKSWTDERNQVAQQIMQGASVVTTSPQPGFALTAQDVVNNLKDQASKAAAFAAQLRQLQKLGLRSDLIAQIAAAGVDQGGATAAALAGASSGTIKQLNSIQGSLSSSANATGAAVADSMYGAGIKAAKGLIKGLQSQESAIEKQMLRIAKSMESAIKKALGIHSPSRVMAELGDHTARGLALGIERSTKHVQIAASGMAMAARQSATITGADGGYVRGGDIHVHVTVQGSVTSERRLVDSIETALATRARLNPGGFRPAATWSGH